MSMVPNNLTSWNTVQQYVTYCYELREKQIILKQNLVWQQKLLIINEITNRRQYYKKEKN
jgi:hypothetical protein